MESLTPDDRVLLAQIAAGDQRAAESFDSRFRPRLLWFAHGRGIPVQDQSDLVQDVLLAAYRQVRDGKFLGKSSLGTWLGGILNHKIADYWERSRREKDHMGGEYIQTMAVQSAIERIPDSALHPDSTLEVREILASLPVGHRVVLLLNITEGLTTEEIAAVLKMPPGTVGRVLWEAKRLFRGNRGIMKKLEGGRGLNG